MSTADVQEETELGRASKKCGGAIAQLLQAMCVGGKLLPTVPTFRPMASITATMISAVVDPNAPARLVGQIDALVKLGLSPAVKEKAFAVRAAARSWAMLQTVADEAPAEQAAEETIDTEK